jgi:hypothetical protein
MAQHNEVKFIKTLKDSVTKDSAFYNVFEYRQKYILLKDREEFDSANLNAENYVKRWGVIGNPVEAGNVFLLNSDFKKIKRADRKFLPTIGLSRVIFSSNAYVADRNNFMEVRENHSVNFMAIVYECTNDHEGKPHSGTDKEEMKTKHGCTTFKALLVSSR